MNPFKQKRAPFFKPRLKSIYMFSRVCSNVGVSALRTLQSETDVVAGSPWLLCSFTLPPQWV